MPKHERSGAASAAAHGNPAAEQVLDGIILAIRKFIAAAIFFNAQAAEQAGLSLTDMQMIHTLELYGPADAQPSGRMDRPEQRRRDGRTGSAAAGRLPAPRAQPRRPAQPAGNARPGAPETDQPPVRRRGRRNPRRAGPATGERSGGRSALLYCSGNGPHRERVAEAPWLKRKSSEFRRSITAGASVSWRAAPLAVKLVFVRVEKRRLTAASPQCGAIV